MLGFGSPEPMQPNTQKSCFFMGKSKIYKYNSSGAIEELNGQDLDKLDYVITTEKMTLSEMKKASPKDYKIFITWLDKITYDYLYKYYMGTE